jgi:hypothetical protein
MMPAAFLYGGNGWRGLFVAAFVVGCSGIWRYNWHHPVLVDAPALATTLWAAVCWHYHIWWLAILLVCAAAAMKEASPLFAAMFAWTPWLLVGFAVVAIRAVMKAGPDVLDQNAAWILAHPVRASRKYHAGMPVEAFVMPWGAGLAAAADLSPQLALTVAAAYSQVLVATDTTRLYQWAWPVVAVAASQAVPVPWLLPLILVHVANPFAGQGL